jgi:hypothetical protein
MLGRWDDFLQSLAPIRRRHVGVARHVMAVLREPRISGRCGQRESDGARGYRFL